MPSHIYDVFKYIEGYGEYLSLDADFKQAFKESVQVLELSLEGKDQTDVHVTEYLPREYQDLDLRLPTKDLASLPIRH